MDRQMAWQMGGQMVNQMVEESGLQQAGLMTLLWDGKWAEQKVELMVQLLGEKLVDLKG